MVTEVGIRYGRYLRFIAMGNLTLKSARKMDNSYLCNLYETEICKVSQNSFDKDVNHLSPCVSQIKRSNTVCESMLEVSEGQRG